MIRRPTDRLTRLSAGGFGFCLTLENGSRLGRPFIQTLSKGIQPVQRQAQRRPKRSHGLDARRFVSPSCLTRFSPLQQKPAQ
jgi:hypothetical protein